MRSLARMSLGLLGLALIAPGGVEAQDAPSAVPSGYQAAAPAVMPAPAPIGLDGQPMTAPVASQKNPGKSTLAPRSGKVYGCAHWKGDNTPPVCARCAAKYPSMTANASAPGKIIGCEHSKNGVCTACRAALNMPGTFVMQGQQPAEAPGRAVASSSPASGRPGPGQAPAYDPGMSMGDPAPVGVVQANFAPAGPMGAPSANAPQTMMAPGRAVAESSANPNAGRDPYQAKSGPFPRPHILGHLFGWSGIGSEKAEERAFRKSEAHAMITYDETGKAPVDELPASMVFGKKH